jgi:hypothetical protein
MQNLRFLYLNKNKIQSLPESIGKCQKLQELDVVRCGIIRMPSSLNTIRALENVYIDERTIPFYENRQYRFRQVIHVIQPGDLLYRPSQNP